MKKGREEKTNFSKILPNNQIITACRIELWVQEMTMNEKLTMIGLMSFFLGSKKRDLLDKTGDREDSKKVKESDSLRSLPDVVFSDGLNSGISKIICKLFKKYKEPSKGAFYLPLRGKGTPN